MKNITYYLITSSRPYSDNVILIDSSKNLDGIKVILDQHASHGLSASAIKIVFSIKTPQEFAMSIARKNATVSLSTVLQAFNWWFSINEQMIEFCEQHKELVRLSTYRELCVQPSTLVNDIAKQFHVYKQGNKNFALRNSDHITYDNEWRNFWQIRFVNFFHFRASRLYKKLNNNLT